MFRFPFEAGLSTASLNIGWCVGMRATGYHTKSSSRTVIAVPLTLPFSNVFIVGAEDEDRSMAIASFNVAVTRSPRSLR